MSEERKKIVGVNLGNWLVLEKWMQPFLFEENCAEDEVWLNRKVPAKKLRPLMKKHRDTYIEAVSYTHLVKISNAGADLIIGDHPHVLQQFGYCEDTPVMYSLGNFLFNSKAQDTCLVKLTLDAICLQSGFDF